jgi:hypothetical protein
MAKSKLPPAIKDWNEVPNFLIKTARLPKSRLGTFMWMALIRHIRGPADKWTVVEDGGVVHERCQVRLYPTEDAARDAAIRYCLEHRSWWAYAKYDAPESRQVDRDWLWVKSG